ncbi:MAG: NMD3-related protein [Candidatus Aenigmatarchaeota archaeon]
MFCIRCGKKATIKTFCEDCFLEKEKLFDIGNYELKFCNMCKSIFDNDKKIDIKESIKNRIKSNNKIKEINIKTKTVGNRIYASIICLGYIRPCKKMKKEEKKILVILRNMLCQTCKKLSGSYYEAVFQVRDEPEKIMNKIKEISDNIIVSGIEKTKNGYNIKFIDKKQAANLANRLRKYFSVKETYKLIGEKKGEKLYRNYYAIRPKNKLIALQNS